MDIQCKIGVSKTARTWRCDETPHMPNRTQKLTNSYRTGIIMYKQSTDLSFTYSCLRPTAATIAVSGTQEHNQFMKTKHSLDINDTDTSKKTAFMA